MGWVGVVCGSGLGFRTKGDETGIWVSQVELGKWRIVKGPAEQRLLGCLELPGEVCGDVMAPRGIAPTPAHRGSAHHVGERGETTKHRLEHVPEELEVHREWVDVAAGGG